jgi:proline iminopeptidase
MLGSFAVLLVLALIGAATQSEASDDTYAPGRKIIADIDRIVVPNGVQETFEVKLGGARQVVNVRGSDRANPILLFVHGGPGAVEMPVAWRSSARGRISSRSCNGTSAGLAARFR